MKKAYLALIIFFVSVSVCFAAYTTKVYKDQGGDRIVIASGGTLLVEDGATVTMDDGVLAPGDIALADGSIIIGNSSGVGSTLAADGIVRNIRTRVIIADVNAGVDLLPAVTGKRYRLISCSAIAYGGAVGTLTSVDVSGDDGSAAILVSFLQANLTQSTVLISGGTGATVLADGASYVSNTAATAISVKTVGTAGDTATGIDFIVDYVIE